VSHRFELRPATAGDIDQLLAHLQAGFDSYASFAPEGWQPPQAVEIRDATIALINDPRTYAVIASRGGQPVGHGSFYPGRDPSSGEVDLPVLERTIIAGLAHLLQLFVLPDWWGTGAAQALHDSVVGEMRAQGYERARLFTPSRHARARRFYERNGWVAGEPHWNEWFALELSEYRLELS
jgi:GNAT superfamily N-acetyltransferase